jgi:hypothetical protein
MVYLFNLTESFPAMFLNALGSGFMPSPSASTLAGVGIFDRMSQFIEPFENIVACGNLRFTMIRPANWRQSNSKQLNFKNN